MEKLYTRAEVSQEDKGLFVASSAVEDRQGEIIDQEGWKLDNFKKNPVLQWAHNPSEPTIGKAEKIGYKTINGKKKLVFRPKFHKKSDMSKLISDLVEEGYINATSVGFRPLEQDDNTFTKSELLEISFVNVPANQDALGLAYAKGYDKATIKSVMPDADLTEKEDVDMALKMKDMEEKFEKMEGELQHIKKLSDKTDKGRKPLSSIESKDQSRLKAIKVINKAMEILNKTK